MSLSSYLVIGAVLVYCITLMVLIFRDPRPGSNARPATLRPPNPPPIPLKPVKTVGRPDTAAVEAPTLWEHLEEP